MTNLVRMPMRRNARAFHHSAQRGAALLVALILLIVITLVGLAAVGTTIIQNQMAANQYDRQIAFQSAEAGLRAATALISNNPGIVSRDCQLGGQNCLADPFKDPNLPSGAIHNVSVGSGAGDFSTGTNAAASPQYVVESLGQWNDYQSSNGYGQTANSRQYGSQGTSTTAIYYRITSRSGDPAKVGSRSVVTLQAIVRQG